MTQPPEGAWFNPLAAYLGSAYLRNAFTKGTEQEVEFLVEALELAPGQRVLDAGCGPGRHSLALARRGIEVVGVDLSPEFLAIARASADGLPVTFVEEDVRNLSYSEEFDAVICLCQGGFGLLGGGDDEHDAVAGLARCLRPGGRLALSAFSAWFALRNLESGETFDPATAVLHERARLRDEQGIEQDFDLWTTCFTPRELRLVALRAGLRVDGVHGVAPGRYRLGPAALDTPEHLLLARLPR